MTMTTESQALTDLLARAGASDQDRALWLAERAQGVTATEIAGLKTGQKNQDDLIAVKLGRKVDTFTGNQYTDWGKEREPVIAEALRGMGIEPESRVFHGIGDSRHLASPDGLGVDFDDALIVSEIKTAAYDLPPGSQMLAKKGYVHQMQWAMHVTGAGRCRFVVEERLTTAWDALKRPIAFEPGPVHEYWIERDDAAIAELVKIADEFLAELDRQREDGAPAIDEEIDTHAVNYLRGLAAEKEGKALKESAYKALLEAGKSQESPLARVTYSPAKPGTTLDVEEIDYETAKATHFGKALFDELQSVTARWQEHLEGFTKTVPVTGKGTAARVTVTASKATKEVKA